MKYTTSPIQAMPRVKPPRMLRMVLKAETARRANPAKPCNDTAVTTAVSQCTGRRSVCRCGPLLLHWLPHDACKSYSSSFLNSANPSDTQSAWTQPRTALVPLAAGSAPGSNRRATIGRVKLKILLAKPPCVRSVLGLYSQLIATTDHPHRPLQERPRSVLLPGLLHVGSRLGVIHRCLLSEHLVSLLGGIPQTQ